MENRLEKCWFKPHSSANTILWNFISLSASTFYWAIFCSRNSINIQSLWEVINFNTVTENVHLNMLCTVKMSYFVWTATIFIRSISILGLEIDFTIFITTHTNHSLMVSGKLTSPDVYWPAIGNFNNLKNEIRTPNFSEINSEIISNQIFQ